MEWAQRAGGSMIKRMTPLGMVLVGLTIAACSGDGSPIGPEPLPPCTNPTTVSLPFGGAKLVDQAAADCILLEGGDSDREYLVIGYSGAGQVTLSGISGGYEISGTPATATATTLRSPLGFDLVAPIHSVGPGANSQAQFDASLRRSEERLARSGLAQLSPSAAAHLVGPPTVGAQESFFVCLSLECGQRSQITARARVVGSSGVIWVDTDLPSGSEELTTGDLQELSDLFDDYLYPIDTLAFGPASDIDGNERVDIVVTDAVNDLTTDCSKGRVVGYFYGGDLLSSKPDGNRAEVFFALSPKPATAGCGVVTRDRALSVLPPVLIHEMQHMISFGQRVLMRRNQAEVGWLNEGMSHFAEELGQREIPDSRCPHSPSCFSEFASGNLDNAYDFMRDPEATFLVAGVDPGPSLTGRGAAWLMVRWLADHFASDTILGTQLTRALINNAPTGADNIMEASGGIEFQQLVGEWLASLYVDNLPGFPQDDGRLQYKSWDFRGVFARNSPDVFPLPFPLIPTPSDGRLALAGTLRAGTGHYAVVSVASGSNGVQLGLTGPNGSAPSALLDARLMVVRTK